MLARITLVLAVVLAVPSAPQAQGGYAEPPPSPPVKAAPAPAGPLEPPTVTPAPVAPVEPPTVTPPPTATPTATPDPSTSTSTTTSTTTTTSSDAAPGEAGPVYEPYSPSQMTWGIPPSSAGASAAAGAADPSLASSSYRGVEWGLGALAADGGGMIEGTVLADLGALSLGMMLVLGGRNEHAGAGVLLAGGPRFRLADGIRLDGLVDVGLMFFGDDTSETSFSAERTSGSDEVLPAIGARLGVTFTSAARGWYVSLGAGIRHVPRTTVEYTTSRCGFLYCTESKGTATYGGTIAGGYLTFGQGAARRVPRAP